jgi:hypothetical protein
VIRRWTRHFHLKLEIPELLLAKNTLIEVNYDPIESKEQKFQ